MDRQIVYPGSIPLDTDLLNIQRNTMIALGYLAQATLGSSTVVDGLACLPTSPASLQVAVGPGSITLLGPVDAYAYGSLPADATDPLVKVGINSTSTPFSLTAPTVSGQTINYLLQASLIEADTTPVVLPYYNASNPALPFSGPSNAGTAQNTQITQRVQLQLKSGAAGTTGSQPTPAVDNGWVGLYVLSVAFAQTQVTATSIAALPGAPLVRYKLPALTPGYRNMAVLTTNSAGSWTAPAGVVAVKLRVWGGGGGGGTGNGGAGGGGAGAGYVEGFFAVSPGQSYAVTIGLGGSGSGGNGGTSSFSSIASASGGGAGGNGAQNGAGGASGGAGSGFATGATLISGSVGQAAAVISGTWLSGHGGGSGMGSGGVGLVGASGANVTGNAGVAPGGAGGGGLGTALGGNGAPGLVIVEW